METEPWTFVGSIESVLRSTEGDLGLSKDISCVRLVSVVGAASISKEPPRQVYILYLRERRESSGPC